MKPTKSILDPSFVYKNSGQTDVRKTWAKYRREQSAADAQKAQANVTAIKRVVKKS